MNSLPYNASMSAIWERILIRDKPADVFEPASTGSPRFGLLFLHDCDGRTVRERPAFSRILEAADLACICPFGDATWWTDRPCPNFDKNLTAERYLLDVVLPHFDERWKISPRAIGVLGIGMGGQGALRLAFKHPRQFLAVAGIEPSIEYQELYGQGTPLDFMYDSKEQCRQDTAILHLHPAHHPPHIFYCCDPESAWYRGCDRLHEKMNALGVEHTVDFSTFAGADYAERMADRSVQFLLAGLEKEARRLI
jgi:S-formylglutathione hydrolase